MKKSFIFVALAAVIAMCATSCKKDESVLKFTATIERGNGKTSLADWDNSQRQVVWSEDDEIKVWGFGPGTEPTYANLGYKCKLTAGNGTTRAEFEVNDDYNPSVYLDLLTESSRFTAGYPAHNWLSEDIVFVGSEQFYIPGDVYHYPMMAVSENTHLEFKNVCGIIEIKLPQVQGIRLSGLKIIADHQIAGNYLVSWNNGNPILQPTNENASDNITLSFPREIDLSADTRPSVLAYLPAGDHTGITIEFYTTDFTYTQITASANHPINVTRSKITTLDFSSVNETSIEWRPTPKHRNYFSVSDILQVDIAQGNLVCGTDADYFWSIAQNQWSVYGNGTHMKDLFYANYSNNYGLVSPVADGSFTDWGYLVTQNAGDYENYQSIDTRWRSLSADEWEYLIGRQNGELYVLVELTDYNFQDEFRPEFKLGGLLLMPDDWNTIEGRPTLTLTTEQEEPDGLIDEEEGETLGRKAKITHNQLLAFLEKGCAFLPNAGTTPLDYPAEADAETASTAYYLLSDNYLASWTTLRYIEEDESSEYYNRQLFNAHFKQVVQQGTNDIWRYAVRLVRNAKYQDATGWHYYSGFDPDQNTSAKKKRK